LSLLRVKTGPKMQALQYNLMPRDYPTSSYHVLAVTQHELQTCTVMPCRFTYVPVKTDDYLGLFFTTAFLIHRLCQSVRRRDNKTEHNISMFKPAMLELSKGVTDFTGSCN
jgi:hypothetical protein